MRWLQRLLGRPAEPPAKNPYTKMVVSWNDEEIEAHLEAEYERLGLKALALETVFETVGGSISLYEGATGGQWLDERLAKLYAKVQEAYTHLPKDEALSRQIRDLHLKTSCWMPGRRISEICRQLYRDGTTELIQGVGILNPITHTKDFSQIIEEDGGHWDLVYPHRIIRWEKSRADSTPEPVYEEQWETDYACVGIRWNPWGSPMLRAIANERSRRRDLARKAAEKATATQVHQREFDALDPEIRELLKKERPTRGPS